MQVLQMLYTGMLQSQVQREGEESKQPLGLQHFC